MKKITVLCIALLLALGVPFGFLSGAVLQEKDRITVKEKVLFGERSAANGLTVERLFGYDEHLFWRMTYQAGEKASYDAEYSFTASEHTENNPYVHGGFWIDGHLSIGADLDRPAEEQKGLAKAVKELYDRTPIGSEGEQVIYLKDIYEYYPFEFCFDLPKITMSGMSYDSLRPGLDEDEKRVIKAFSEFFRFPVSDSAGFHVQIEVLGKKNVSIGATTVGEFYLPETESVYTDSTCYFAISNCMNSGNPADFSLIPGGYGIYAFGYGYGKELTATGVNADSLRMVYPLDESERVISLSLDEKEENLFVFTQNEEGFCFYAIELAAMRLTQKHRFEGERLLSVENCGDFFFLELDEMRVAVLTKEEGGAFRHALTVPLTHAKEKWFDAGCAKAFDGERLALVFELYEEESMYIPLCGFALAVYDETGLLFHAEYLSDLEPNLLDASRQKNCLPAEEHALIYWN